jgi:carbonic anhydrase
MERLIAGFRQFQATHFSENRETFAQLAENGQSPRALVIACCDSRVDPQMIFGVGPGEIFVIRNVANLVPPFEPGAEKYHGTSAALEFGVRGLQVEHIIVLGHGGCGGIRALLQGPGPTGTDFIGSWMQIADDARQRVLTGHCCQAGDDPQRALELEAIKTSLANLMSFPWIRERVEAGQLELHGWLFALDSGELLYHDPEQQKLVPFPTAEGDEIDEAAHHRSRSSLG